jgi:hypothetical protein
MPPLKTRKVARWFLYVDLNYGRGTCYTVLATASEIRKRRKLTDGDRMFLHGRWVILGAKQAPPRSVV